jgi:hypothetical protein
LFIVVSSHYHVIDVDWRTLTMSAPVPPLEVKPKSVVAPIASVTSALLQRLYVGHMFCDATIEVGGQFCNREDMEIN